MIVLMIIIIMLTIINNHYNGIHVGQPKSAFPDIFSSKH